MYGFSTSPSRPLRTQPLSVDPVDAAVMQHVSPVYWDWRTAFDRDPSASPLQHPDYVLSELHAEDVGQTVLIRSGDAFAILVPKRIRTTQAGGLPPAWTLRGLRLAGGRFLGPDQTVDRQRDLLGRVTEYATSRRAAFVLIEDLDIATPLSGLVQERAVHGCGLFVSHDYQPRRMIEFPDTAEDYWKTFSSRSLSKHRRNLKKFGQTRLQRITTLSDIPAFLQAAAEISAQSWQTRQFGQRIRNDELQLRQFSALAEQGMLRSYLWWVEETPVAFAVCNQHAGTLRYEEIAYRQEFAQFSPGRTMLFQIVEDLFQHNSPGTLDFGGGDAEYKQQFANRESQSGTVWLVPPSWRSQWTVSYLTTCRRARSAARQWIRNSRMGTRLRQWFHRGSSAPVNPVGSTATPQAGGEPVDHGPAVETRSPG